MLIGCDFHTRYRRTALLEEAIGESTERRLDDECGGRSTRRLTHAFT